MLKSNSKKAKENIQNYIINNFDCSNYEVETEPTTWQPRKFCVKAILRSSK